MYTVLALAVVLVVVSGLGAMAFRFTGLSVKVVGRLRSKILGRSGEVLFRGAAAQDREVLFFFRLWAGVSVAVLLALSAGVPGVFRNVPEAIGRSVGVSTLSTFLGGLVVLGTIACLSCLPRARGYATMSRHGFRAFWVADPQDPSRLLLQELASRAQISSAIRILDVTGFDLIGKGPGLSGGLIYDTLASMTGVPVQLLLLEPEARVLDPEHKHATIFQSLLAEMEVTPATYQRRVRATLDAVEALNEMRAPQAKIDVRLYAEKPEFRAIVFDESAFVGPWMPLEGSSPVPFLQIARDSEGASLYEGFRRQVARLWRSATVDEKGAPAQKQPSTVVRRRPAPDTVEA